MGIRENEGSAEGLKGFYGPKKAYIKEEQFNLGTYSGLHLISRLGADDDKTLDLDDKPWECGPSNTNLYYLCDIGNIRSRERSISSFANEVYLLWQMKHIFSGKTLRTTPYRTATPLPHQYHSRC